MEWTYVMDSHEFPLRIRTNIVITDIEISHNDQYFAVAEDLANASFKLNS